SPRLRSASNTALPNACWPCTTIRIRLPSPNSPCHSGRAKREPESIFTVGAKFLDRWLWVPATGSPRRQRRGVPLAGTTAFLGHAASARAPFSDAVIAPEALISAISALL